ncbi:E3 ubiquitin-protein ligase TRIM17-like [Phascolarctos cinereus]
MPTHQKTAHGAEQSSNLETFCAMRLQNLALSGKLLRTHLLQSIRDLTICDKHREEENLFCEDDHRLLCWSCFLTTDHKEHKVLPLEEAGVQCMGKLQAMRNILKGQKEKFQIDLEYEKLKEEEEQLHLQRLAQDTRDKLAKFEESQAKLSQQIHNLQVVISEVEDNFEKPLSEILQDMKGTLERNEELFLQDPVVASTRSPSLAGKNADDFLGGGNSGF